MSKCFDYLGHISIKNLRTAVGKLNPQHGHTCSTLDFSESSLPSHFRVVIRRENVGRAFRTFIVFRPSTKFVIWNIIRTYGDKHMNLFSQSESSKCVVTAVHTCSSKTDACSAIQQMYVCNVVSVSTGHADRTSASAVGLPYWSPSEILHTLSCYPTFTVIARAVLLCFAIDCSKLPSSL